MPRGHVNLPERTERRRLLREFENAAEGKDIEGYEAYARALQTLNGKLEALSEIGDDGSPQALTAQTKAEIQQAIRDTAAAGETYLKNAAGAGAMEKSVPSAAVALQERLSRDMTAVLRYDVKAGKSLPEVLNEERTPTVNAGNKKLEAAYGATRAQRIPMAVVDRKGGRREGFFTKKETVAPKAQWDALVEEIAAKYPTKEQREKQEQSISNMKSRQADIQKELEKLPPEPAQPQQAQPEEGQPKRMSPREELEKEYQYYADKLKEIEERNRTPQKLRNLLGEYKTGLIRKHPELEKKSDDYFAHRLMRDITGDVKREDADREAYENTVYKNMKKLGLDLKNLEDGADVVAQREFAERLKPIYLSAQQASASSHRVGDRVDHRSAAMNAVGDLLGEPELLARSMPMKLKDADGQIVEGSFTEKSKGYDLDNSIQSFAGVSDDPFAGTDGKCLRQLADLQVLDYLCGNVGRHFGSMTYETDDKGKIVGVQGFGNDSSFGHFADGKKGRGKLPAAGDLGVVSASMAKKIKAMDPDTLRFTLRGRGLSKEEIDFSVQRLADLKQAIREGDEYYRTRSSKKLSDPVPLKQGCLRTVPDEEFAKLDIRQLWSTDPDQPLNGMHNIFFEVESQMELAMVQARRIGFRYTGENLEAFHHPTEVKTTDSAFTMDKFAFSLRGADKLVKSGSFDVDNLTKGRRGSKQFDDVVKAAKKLETMQKDFDALAAKGLDFSASEYRYHQQRLATAVKDLETKNQAYQERKMRQRNAADPRSIKAKNEYEKNRIDYSLKVDRFLEDAKKRLPPSIDRDLTAEEKAYFQSAAERSRLIRQKDYLDGQKGQEPQEPQQPQGPQGGPPAVPGF